MLLLPLALFVAWSSGLSALAEGATFVPAGSVWKYLVTPVDPAPGWQSLGFDDSGWAAGRAQLGYGDGDEVTLVGYGGDSGNKYITTYFRHTFAVTNAQTCSNLVLRLIHDDGAVVYLNGIEVARTHMPPWPVDCNTLATMNVREDAYMFYSRIPIMPAMLLVDGLNVLAVEIHQVSRTSSDMSFDLEFADEALSLTSIIDLDASATFASPAHIDLTTKAANTFGVTNVTLYVNGARQDQKSMLNRLYASFDCAFSVPTNCSLAVAAFDKAGGASTSSVQVAVEPGPDPAQVVPLLGPGAQWKFQDDGADLGTAWKSPDYSDLTWSTGPAPLGYGATGIVTPVRSVRGDGTTIITTYFRRAWDVPDPSRFEKLALRVLRDDGVRVYLNGAVVFQNNLPSEAGAGAVALEPADATAFLTSAYIAPSLLVTGRNVLAVEIHQAAAGPADLVFDLELTGLTAPPLPRLAIGRTTPNTARIAWPHPSTGFRLMETPSLSQTNWTEVTNAPAPVGENLEVTVPAPPGARFYRLRKD